MTRTTVSLGDIIFDEAAGKEMAGDIVAWIRSRIGPGA